MVQPMIDVPEVLKLQSETVAKWHEQPISNPYPGVFHLICEQHTYNYQLWHEEDIARSRDVTDEKIELIKRVVEETDYYDLKLEPTRFYLFATIAETNIQKTSPGGIFGMRYLDLSKMDLAVPLNNETSLGDLASALRGQKFE